MDQPPTDSLNFPIRAAFYYPWYPQAWNQSGFDPYTSFKPQSGFYSSDDRLLVRDQIQSMQYANIQAGIISWWGIGHYTDLRVPMLLEEAGKTGFKWALYIENEGYQNPSEEDIVRDIQYIRQNYANQKEYLHVDGKFVIFVYGSISEDCSLTQRWMNANPGDAYIVLKIFPGYRRCSTQPDAWHEYAPAVDQRQVGQDSYSISPGFSKLDDPHTILLRNLGKWQQSVRNMVASGAHFQLVTTFNEWGEGTAVENAVQWESSTQYGSYLDALHWNGWIPSPAWVDPDSKPFVQTAAK